MKFYKETWERKAPALTISEDALYEMISPAFPNKNIESYELVSAGLANTNIRFKFTDKNNLFLLRIYTRDASSLHQEMALQKRFGQQIPMPSFLHTGTWALHTYAIQPWIEGVSLHEIFNLNFPLQIETVSKSVGKTLSIIHKNTFPTSGFFNKNLDILPFEKKDSEHPFVSYIEDCLLKEYAGKWLGEPLASSLWKFVLDNQAYFPPLEPASLVQGDFNPDNILIDPKTNKVVAVLDWEFSFPGSYLFDLGNLLRFEIPTEFEQTFVKTYEAERGIKLPEEWQKIIKIQDLSNLVGLLNTPHKCPNRIKDIKRLIEQTIKRV